MTLPDRPPEAIWRVQVEGLELPIEIRARDLDHARALVESWCSEQGVTAGRMEYELIPEDRA